MTVIFDGKGFAYQKEEVLLEKVAKIRKRGTIPKLTSIIVGNDPASSLYVNLKKKAAERVGCEVEIKKFDTHVHFSKLVYEIKKLNKDNSVHGIMIQLPLPKKFTDKERKSLINTIVTDKDVDGLREDSKFTPPTAKAVVQIMNIGEKLLDPNKSQLTIAVVGASGFIGKQIVDAIENLGNENLKLIELDSKSKGLKSKTKKADVLISVTGVPNLIKKDMVRDGVVLIDVGAPKGDANKHTYEKASFVSPVPGGVGPVTISCLLENLTENR